MQLSQVVSYHLVKGFTSLSNIALFIFCFILFCPTVNANDVNKENALSMNTIDAIKLLSHDFEQLPEKQIAMNGGMYAQYARPSSRYNHNILGDAIEAEELVVLKDGITYTNKLSEQYVYEDIKPRLFDVDSDGELEIITIRTHVNKGAGIMIYKIVDNNLTEFAWVDEVGLSNRWLNIVAVYDLDNDGNVELVWVQTPHIGGILKVAKIKAGNLQAFSETSPYSNHSIGERNLCLSVVTQTKGATSVYVPTQDRRNIARFMLVDGSLQKVETINQSVNFSNSLTSQYNFSGIVQGEDFCTAL